MIRTLKEEAAECCNHSSGEEEKKRARENKCCEGAAVQEILNIFTFLQGYIAEIELIEIGIRLLKKDYLLPSASARM